MSTDELSTKPAAPSPPAAETAAGAFFQGWNRLPEAEQKRLARALAAQLDAQLRRGPTTTTFDVVLLTGVFIVVGSAAVFGGAVVIGLAIRLARWSAGL